MRNRWLLILLLIPRAIHAEEAGRLTLPESIRLAVEGNAAVAAARESVRQAEFSWKDARTLPYPSLFSSASVTRLDKAQEVSLGLAIPGMPSSFKATDDTLYNVTLTLAQPVFTGGRIDASRQQARELLQKAQEDYRTTLLDIAVQVRQAYFSVLKADRMLEVTRSLQKQAREHLSVVEAFLKSGLTTRVDVLKTEVFLAQVNQQFLEAENGLALAQAGFNHLLERPLDAPVLLEDILEPVEPDRSLEDWRQAARENRPEIRALERLARVSDETIRLARSTAFPQVTALGNFVNERGTQSSLNAWKTSWNAVLAMEWDLWNWNSTRYKVQRERSARAQTEKNLQALRNVVELETKNAFLNLQAAAKRIETARASIREAEENLRLTKLQYREGLTTTTEVLDAQVMLSQASNSYFQALYDYQVSHARLLRASGLDTDIERLTAGEKNP